MGIKESEKKFTHFYFCFISTLMRPLFCTVGTLTFSLDFLSSYIIIYILCRADNYIQLFTILSFSRAADVMETRGFNEMVTSHPRLVADAFRALAATQSPPACSARKKRRTDVEPV